MHEEYIECDGARIWTVTQGRVRRLSYCTVDRVGTISFSPWPTCWMTLFWYIGTNSAAVVDRKVVRHTQCNAGCMIWNSYERIGDTPDGLSLAIPSGPSLRLLMLPLFPLGREASSTCPACLLFWGTSAEKKNSLPTARLESRTHCG